MASLQHVFVLMFENRSFDHLLGYSGLVGTDAATGAHTSIDGLTGNETNPFHGVAYPVQRGADYAMAVDPGHEFLNVVDQLCGVPRYSPPYPPINNSGFVESYVASGGSATPGEILRCFDTPRQLPVLYALAQEFAVCDRWFSSMPGPTWPNRMFVHAASSAGLDHSPSPLDIFAWETVDGFGFPRGTVFERLAEKQVPWHLYSGDDFPMVAALKGVTLGQVDRIPKLLSDLQKEAFPYKYVFIEPSYNPLHDYRNSTCMHPLADVRLGEAFLKQVYEALRRSPIWEQSLLIVTWDEHGGFYDHVAPPPAAAPGDVPPGTNSHYEFTFERLGVRVPAIVISPLIPKGVIDHRIYDHASIPATLECLFALAPLTRRDVGARSVLDLLSLDAPRDAIMTLPSAQAAPALMRALVPSPDEDMDASRGVRPDDAIRGMLPAFLHSAIRADLELSRAANKTSILAKMATLQTRGQAMQYLQEVQTKLRNRPAPAAAG